MVAATAPILLIGFALLIDASATNTLDQQTQAAADAAAEAATKAMANALANGTSLTIAQVESIATNFFNATAPSSVVANETSLTATTTVNGSQVTTSIHYIGARGSLAAGFVMYFSGSPQTVNITATATTSSTSSNSTENYVSTGYVSGMAYLYNSFDNTNNSWFEFYDCFKPLGWSSSSFPCPVPNPSNWYNLLSDANFEINVNLEGSTGTVQQNVYQIDIMAGTHTIQLSPSVATGQLYDGQPVDIESWTGAVTVDGTYKPAPATQGPTAFILIDDTSEGVYVAETIQQPGVAISSGNFIEVRTRTYDVTIAYDFGAFQTGPRGAVFYHKWLNYGYPDINILAQNAGICTTPGGVYGQTFTYGSSFNADYQDGATVNASMFLVSSAGVGTTTVPQFSQTCAATTSTVKLQ